MAVFEPVLEAYEVGDIDPRLEIIEADLRLLESAFEALIALYPPMLEDLGHQRAERLNSASKMSECLIYSVNAMVRAQRVYLPYRPSQPAQTRSIPEPYLSKRKKKTGGYKANGPCKYSQFCYHPLLTRFQEATDSSALIKNMKQLVRF